MPPTTVANKPIIAPSPILPSIMLPIVIVSPKRVRLAIPTIAMCKVFAIGSLKNLGVRAGSLGMQKEYARMRIPNLIHRHVYHLKSPHLAVGVWDELCASFVGLRHQWGELFLDTEPCATPIEDLGPVPEGICLTGLLGTYDSNTNRSVSFENTAWVYKDDGTSVEDCSAVYSRPNNALREYLAPIDERLRRLTVKR